MSPAKLLPILLAVVCATLLAGARVADKTQLLGDTIQVGGQGGSDFRQNCPPGQVLASVDVTVGKDMNSISPQCGVLVGGRIPGETPNRGVFGGERDRPGNASCDPSVVQGMYVEISHVNLVHRVSLLCRDLSNGQNHTARLIKTSFGSEDYYLTQGGEAARTELLNCGSGAFAVGLFGGAGSSVDRLGLICGKLVDIPPPPPPPAEQPAPVQAPKQRAPAAVNNNEVNNDPEPGDAGGDDGGGNGGGGGGNGSANNRHDGLRPARRQR